MDNIYDGKMKLHFLCTLVVIIVLVDTGESEMFRDNCSEENNITWTCNYIPKAVPKLYPQVRIVNFKRQDIRFQLNDTTFRDESWSSVQTLELSDRTGYFVICSFKYGSFKGLTSLKELRIHMDSFYFGPGMFLGLPSVHTLDMSRSYRFALEDLAEQLREANTLPLLQKLILSEIGRYYNRNNINQKDVDAFLPRNITSIDISVTQLGFVNFTAILKTLKTLEHVNVSYSTLTDTWGKNIKQEDVLHVKNIDYTHTVLPSKTISFPPAKLVISNFTSISSPLSSQEEWINILTPLVINASRIVPTKASIWLYNCTFIIDEQLHFKVQQLISRKNNIRYLDVNFVCPRFKFEFIKHVDLSGNGLEMIHPVPCAPNLEEFELSENKLYKMLEKKSDLFEELFKAHPKLRVISLSNNQLPSLPSKVFGNNENIEIIDLSFNKLDQLHLNLENLYRLRIINLSNNRIKMLDILSISGLNKLPCSKSPGSEVVQCSIVLTANPLTCSTCVSKSFISWLINTKLVQVKNQRLTCTNEDGKSVQIDHSVVQELQKNCKRGTIMAVSVVSALTIMLVLLLTVALVYRRRRKAKRGRNRENVMNRLIEGDGQYEFVTFLSYCSKDVEFVQQYVADTLNENLKLMTGIGRNLVCTGDQYFRPGFMVHNETLKCIDRVSVVIVVVSNNYCQSAYCQSEFDQAYAQSKPIVLMFMENVEEDIMTPAMRQLFKRDVRILWTFENGQFALKTSWENVCTSVLDKIRV